MGKKATNLLPLEDCFQRLKCINHAIKSPKDVAQLYTAALGLYCHLKKEQGLLHGKAKANEPCPAFDQTPAMTAVVSDPRLFASLLRCLKVPPRETESEGSSSSAAQQLRRNMNHRGSNTGSVGHLRTNAPTAARIIAAAGRKRGMSFSEDSVASKLAKTSAGLSPMMSKQKMMAVVGSGNSTTEALLPVQIIAASIFYASLQHLDHWPAPLLHAYAEDAFGPRLWVDRQECQLLVSNLKLALDKESFSVDVNQEMSDQAEEVANYYVKMLIQTPPEESLHPKLPPRSSFSSISRDAGPLSRETSLTRTGSMEEAAFPEDDDSDSGEEEIVEVSMGTVVKPTASGGGGGDDSSSSGEEEVVMTAAASFGQGDAKKTPAVKKKQYPVPPPKQINLERIRRRFFGANTDLGFAGITNALSMRLEVKSKQNSRLLQALPHFCIVPGVRALIAKSLGKWLQSPALSGAARTLFASTVQHLQNCDPPLPQDLEAIDSILSMQLKANQLNMHIDNVTNVAKGIPTAAVSRHIFLKILRKEVGAMDNASQSSEHLQMVCAVHAALAKNLRNDGLAAAILTLLAEPHSPDAVPTRRERNQLVRKIKLLLRRLFSTLGASYFDGCGIVESLLSFDFNPLDWSARDEEDKGRIILECIALHVPSPPEEGGGSMRGKGKKFVKSPDSASGLSSEEVTKLRKMLLVARRLMITWCVMDYAPLWQAENKSAKSTPKSKSPFNSMMQKKRKEDIIGAGPPDFSSILDDEAMLSDDSTCPDAMKCVLFMVEPDSSEMQNFLYPEGAPQSGDSASMEEMHQIRQCYQYGADLDDKMLSIILASTAEPERGINASSALSLMEHLFECCKTGRDAELRVTDASIVWDMYKLVEYIPETIPKLPKTERKIKDDPNDQFADAEDEEEDMEVDKANNGTIGEEDDSFPRLARPGSWWRVTALALVMTGASPSGIGSALSQQHPTLRELIKMVTSVRYRFPTVDWDDSQREEMKKRESETRQQESKAAELLFLPPLPDKLKLANAGKHAGPHGPRVSIRQRQRQDRMQREKQEKEVAEAAVLASKRKKMLKVAQKSIMIWDPKGPARKPPKESVNLILSVEKMFRLSETYQKCVESDLVQAAIGDTSRGAIERAYDWLIPVISTIPSVIDRLPASASCFLLLRVYGTESEGNSKLRELSAPLLEHVRKTVTGGFGQEDAIRSTNLLLADVADKKPARRRCARRVLQEALAELNKKIDDKSYESARCTWMRSLLLVDHIEALLPDAIKYLSEALSHERGRVLRAFILSLHDYIDQAKKKEINGTWNFSTSLCELMSTRQSVCSEAIDRFVDLRKLAIGVVHEDFKGHLESKENGHESSQAQNSIQFTPCRSYRDGKVGLATLPLALLQSACVLLSIWKEAGSTDDTSKDSVTELANILMFPFDSPEALLLEADKVEGVAGATMAMTGSPAVSVDEWVMLAKSRSDYIARRAALSAPAKFLPRLLLCSGLPKTSLLTMIDRLGKLGEKSENKSKVYRELLMPSATTDWGFGQIGTRREIARKLLGRLSAYVSMSGDSPEKLSEEISFTFIGWLSEECQPPEKARKGRPLKKAIKAGLTSGTASKLSDAEALLKKVAAIDDVTDDTPLLDDDDDNTEPEIVFKPALIFAKVSPPHIQDANEKAFIEECCARNDSDSLESWIKVSLFSEQYRPLGRRHGTVKHQEPTNKFSAALLLLECSLAATDTNSEYHRVVERWTPLLSSSEGNPKFWKILFSEHESELSADCIVAACCEVWCPSHIASCRDWILTNSKDLKGMDLQRIVGFLLQTSGQHAAHAPSFQRLRVCSISWFETKESVDSVVSLCFECAKVAGEVIDNRNAIAAWLQLLLLVAQTGKRQANHMVNIVLLKVDQAKHEGLRMLMAEAILRVYSYYPLHVSLGNPKLRTLLVDASKSIDWRTWRTPMDETLDDMLAGLKVNPSQRLVHGLVELSKSHPLILLRKLDAMADILENDASAANRGVSRVRIQAENLEGVASAMYNGHEVKIVIRHWGYSYTDPLWVSFLEILLSVPREVLFSCGMRMGLDGFLLVYVKLLYIQSQLQNREKVVRLKTRFMDLIKAFEKDPAWNEWLASPVVGLDSLNTVRNVLIRCSLITTDQAMENIRSAQGEK